MGRGEGGPEGEGGERERGSGWKLIMMQNPKKSPDTATVTLPFSSVSKNAVSI